MTNLESATQEGGRAKPIALPEDTINILNDCGIGVPKGVELFWIGNVQAGVQTTNAADLAFARHALSDLIEKVSDPYSGESDIVHTAPAYDPLTREVDLNSGSAGWFGVYLEK